MKTLLGLFTTLALATSLVAQSRPSAPEISRIFDFSCNSNFTSCPQGFDPTLSPVQLSNGNFYGVTWWAGQGSSENGGTVWKATPAGKVMALHTFASTSGAFPDGENPVIGFAAGADGNLYGTTASGGTANAGVFYKLTPSGSFTALYNFCSLPNCTDGSGPIILGQDGNFYGTVRDSDVLFQVTPQGVWSLVYTLSSGSFKGSLVQASDGTLYGTGTGTNEAGFVFSLTPAGVFTTLHNFGEFLPLTSNIVLASNGNLYGATGSEIFQLTPSGEFANIHEMTPTEGLSPSFLLQGSDGNLWGLAVNGGTAPDRPGTLFTLTTSGTFISSEEFNCTTTGCNPEGMVEGSDGNFYGNAITGGAAPSRNPLGTFFKVAAGLKAR
jgi:uncharacterized repeat protein (TIGR03803 family)